MNDRDELEARLRAAQAEKAALEKENRRLARALSRLEQRITLMDKVARGNEEVATSLYRELQDLSQLLDSEKRKVDDLLCNILPASIAERLKTKGGTIADIFTRATVLFADIVGFTRLSENMAPELVVGLLNELFSEFDDLAGLHKLEKIKTIGDAYMVAGGIPVPSSDDALAVAAMALDMQYVIERFRQTQNHPLSIRIGIHCGPVVAGVIGKRKFIYDLWGDTVNTAARMESHGIPGRIQVTEAVYEALRDDFELEERGFIPVKDKGLLRTWLLVCRKPHASRRSAPILR